MKRGLNLPGDRPPWEIVVVVVVAGRGDCVRLSVAIGPNDGELGLLLLRPSPHPHFSQQADRFCPSIPNRRHLLSSTRLLLLLLLLFLLAADDEGPRPRSLPVADDVIHPQRVV